MTSITDDIVLNSFVENDDVELNSFGKTDDIVLENFRLDENKINDDFSENDKWNPVKLVNDDIPDLVEWGDNSNHSEQDDTLYVGKIKKFNNDDSPVYRTKKNYSSESSNDTTNTADISKLKGMSFSVEPVDIINVDAIKKFTCVENIDDVENNLEFDDNLTDREHFDDVENNLEFDDNLTDREHFADVENNIDTGKTKSQVLTAFREYLDEYHTKDYTYESKEIIIPLDSKLNVSNEEHKNAQLSCRIEECNEDKNEMKEIDEIGENREVNVGKFIDHSYERRVVKIPFQSKWSESTDEDILNKKINDAINKRFDEYLTKQNEVILTSVKKLSENATIPTRGSDEAAGWDFYSTEDFILKPNERKLSMTDIAIDIQTKGIFMKLESRSSIAYKKGVTIEAGVIDKDYKKNIGCLFYNQSTEDFVVKKGDRFAQGIFHKYDNTINLSEDVQFGEKVLNRTGGFGSTGV